MRTCILFVLILFTRIDVLQSQDYVLIQNAKATGSDCYELTPDLSNGLGVIWYTDKIDLRKPFDIEFLMNFGSKDSIGADGMAFIMQQVGTRMQGLFGNGIGYGGSVGPSLGIEFDVFPNRGQSISGGNVGDLNDPHYDHIAILSNGIGNHSLSKIPVGHVPALPDSGNIEDGKDHLVRITWLPNPTRIQVYFDCELRLELKYDLVKELFSGNSQVWWGFSGATGLYSNKQTVCLQKKILFNKTYSVCKGASAQLIGRQSVDDKYTWTPKEGLDNPNLRTPIARPSKSTQYVVSYQNYCNQFVNDTIEVEVAGVDLGRDTTLCPGTTLRLSPTTQNAALTWSDGSTGPQLIVSKPGVYAVEARYNDCSVKDTIDVKFKPSITAGLGNDVNLCEGDSLVLTPKLSSTGSIIWDNGTTAFDHLPDKWTLKNRGIRWSDSGMDFMTDQLFNGRRFRALTVVDNFRGPPLRSEMLSHPRRTIYEWR